MKKKKNKYRNPAAIPAKKRKGGPMKNNKDKRVSNKRRQLEIEDNI